MRRSMNTCRARLRARAWIETIRRRTQACSASVARVFGRARGLKLEHGHLLHSAEGHVARVFGRARGLKRSNLGRPRAEPWRRARLRSRAWIETKSCQAPQANAPSRARLRSRAWIETP